MAAAAASRGTRALAVLGRCVRAPFRALVRARDLYVSRMAACAGGGGRGAGLGPVGLVAAPRCQSHGFYRSGSGADDDVRELIRAASRAGRPPGVGVGVGPRSQSVAVARIDEDRACEFGLGDGERAQALEPRSKSCAAVGVAPSASLARLPGPGTAENVLNYEAKFCRAWPRP
ncbi:uncharacterized protein LOC120687520 [Panicum virgatum]|uniref:Uncharacterized protein n=1 Tax=Panicum virgatum TaxID=38727 RepID=A0A8T0MGS9_PANVG|nr:uncharacterized protein LOC120687520 [Panicum virgatum]KAG2535513.1 hypothetical protein PVAP13_9NG119900 [Panicum virgatum]